MASFRALVGSRWLSLSLRESVVEFLKWYAIYSLDPNQYPFCCHVIYTHGIHSQEHVRGANSVHAHCKCVERNPGENNLVTCQSLSIQSVLFVLFEFVHLLQSDEIACTCHTCQLKMTRSGCILARQQPRPMAISFRGKEATYCHQRGACIATRWHADRPNLRSGEQQPHTCLVLWPV